MRHAPVRTAVLILLVPALLLLSGCGKKGPVRPLRQPLPSAVEKLTVRQLGLQLVIAWDIPKTNQDGSPLTNLQGFRIFKMKYDLTEDCPECRDTSVLMQQIDIEYLQQAERLGNRIFIRDAELTPDAGYQYRVVPFNSKGRDGLPARERVPFLTPPPPPRQLRASGHDRLVRLDWQPVNALRQGVELIGYRLYRRFPDEPFGPLPINGEPAAGISFEDFAVENGQDYVYTIRSVVRILDREVESPPSEAAQARPRAGQ